MIQAATRNQYQTKQNFGKLVETQKFTEEFKKVYSRKGLAKTADMISAIEAVREQQHTNPLFDLHLIGVGPLGRIKTKVINKIPEYENAAFGISVSHKLIDATFFLSKNAEILFRKSVALLILTENILKKNN